jgi:hypothetical protein
MAISRTATSQFRRPLPRASVGRDRRQRPELEIALPRTSRYRAHDDDFAETSGRASRHAASDAEAQEDWT